MLIGIISDTHDQIERTRRAVDLLQNQKIETLIHCGDLFSPAIVEICSVLPFYFVFGNRDSDTVPYLRHAAKQFHATCLQWGGEITLAQKRVAVVHGHLKMDVKPLLDAQPDYLLSGHTHIAHDKQVKQTRCINPGALERADHFSVATLDLGSDQLVYFSVER